MWEIKCFRSHAYMMFHRQLINFNGNIIDSFKRLLFIKKNEQFVSKIWWADRSTDQPTDQRATGLFSWALVHCYILGRCPLDICKIFVRCRPLDAETWPQISMLTISNTITPYFYLTEPALCAWNSQLEVASHHESSMLHPRVSCFTLDLRLDYKL